MIAITTGEKYIDIDGYASMIAYRELQRSLGEDAHAISSAMPNASVPPLIQSLGYQLDQTPIVDGVKFILVDISNPDFIDDTITESDIIEILDHHAGFESYWSTKGVKAEIETIGAVCTMVYEKIISHGKRGILDADLCKLLIAGILDNTLNLRADITTERDIDAYNNLKAISGVADDWGREYFAACDAEKAKDYKKAILDDLKIERVSSEFPETIGQIVLESPSNINYQIIADALTDYEDWLMNVISLRDGKSYLYFKGNGVKKYLEELFGTSSKNDYLIVFDHFLLRKQILKQIREKARH